MQSLCVKKKEIKNIFYHLSSFIWGFLANSVDPDQPFSGEAG